MDIPQFRVIPQEASTEGPALLEATATVSVLLSVGFGLMSTGVGISALTSVVLALAVSWSFLT